jgi:hypothetical protein
MKRRSEQLFNKTTGALNFQAVVKHQQEHAHRHAHRDIQVSGRKNTMIVQWICDFDTNTHQVENVVSKIDRNQVQRVHQHDPHEYCHRQWSNELARFFAGNNAASLLVNHVNQHFNKTLESSGNACCRTSCGQQHDANDYQTHQRGPKHRVKVDDTEVSNSGLLFADIVEVHQVVLNICGLGRYVSCSSHERSLKNSSN